MNTVSHEAAGELQVVPACTIQNPVRYIVVGTRWTSQTAFLPGATQSGNPIVMALAMGDEAKTTTLADRHSVQYIHDYVDYDRLLTPGDIGAVYLALSNGMYRQYTPPVLQCGVHILLEEPTATSETDCGAMVEATRVDNAELMIAYRLYFEPITLATIGLVCMDKLSRTRTFSAAFSQSVTPSSHRANHSY